MDDTELPLVFVDTSVLFSACHSSSGYARDLLIAGANGWVQLVISDDVIAEARNNLARKSAAGAELLESLLATGLFLVVLTDRSRVTDVANLVRAKDAPIVAGALTIGATVIASFDQRHLLSESSLIESTWGVRVLTPDRILEEFVRRAHSE